MHAAAHIDVGCIAAVPACMVCVTTAAYFLSLFPAPIAQVVFVECVTSNHAMHHLCGSLRAGSVVLVSADD